jgi:hypothetical protein
MRGALGAPRRDTRSPCLINNFRWRRDCLEPYTTRRCVSSVRWSTKARAAPLNALRVFEAVAARLSFAEAADALHVTPDCA